MKSHFDRNSRAAVWASIERLAGHARRDVDQQEDPDQLGLAVGRAALAAGGPATRDRRGPARRSSAADGRCRAGRPATWTTPLESYDRPTSTVTSASVAWMLAEDVLAEDRAIERRGALALGQVDLEPGVGAAVGLVEVRLGVARPGSAGCGGSRCR